ncbi:MAG: hypothetical protein ABID79_02765 [Elusimicrobiota bacterium]
MGKNKIMGNSLSVRCHSCGGLPLQAVSRGRNLKNRFPIKALGNDKLVLMAKLLQFWRKNVE